MKCHPVQVLLFTWSICLTMSQCGAMAADLASEGATMVVRGRVWTADRKRPWAEAVAVRNERIVAVGSQNDVDHLIGDDTQVIDAGDGLVVPGLIDSHIHL